VFSQPGKGEKGERGKGWVIREWGGRCEEARQAQGGRRREDGEREDEGEEGGRQSGWHAESEMEGRWGMRPRRGKKAKEGGTRSVGDGGLERTGKVGRRTRRKRGKQTRDEQG
jgi:hypothetical protein